MWYNPCSMFEKLSLLSGKEPDSVLIFFEDEQALPEDNPIGGGSEPGTA